MKKKIIVAFFEPDKETYDQLKRFLKSENLDKKFEIKHYKKPIVYYMEEDFTADIIIIDTGSVQGECVTMLGCEDTLYSNLRYFVEKHRSSLICIASYVHTWALDWLERLKEDFEGNDQYIECCRNGGESLTNFLKEKIKYFN
jgi:hypothetical protein